MKSQQKVFLLLNGEVPKKRLDLKKYDLICATDGAYQTLEKMNVSPDLITGDFDSAKHPSKNTRREVIYTPNQDFTDFDKMLYTLYKKNYFKIDVFGASGKEQDHFLGNLHTALKWKDKLKITFYDNYGTYFFAKKNTELKEVKGKTISLFPFPETKSITTAGLQYPLNNENLSLITRIGTRNKAIDDTIKINFTKGELVIFVNES